MRRYGIVDPRLTLLAHHRQTTFKVESQTTGEKYVLRYHRPDYRIPATIRSEFHWLRSLRQNTDVVVPEPVATLDGEDVPRVTAKGLPGDLSCSLMKWVEGKRYFRKNGPGVLVLRQVGQVMSAMHRHAEEFVPPGSFHSPVWNWERLFEHVPAKTIDTRWRPGVVDRLSASLRDRARRLARPSERVLSGRFDALPLLNET